ncbi:hypothetical protein M432DRAFT_122815 [Thermoascus aurantiacus ATCC 26904]
MFAFGRTLAIFSCGNLSDATLCLSVFSIPESNGARGVLIIEQLKEHQHLGKSKGEKGVLYMSMYTASQLDLLHTQTHTGVLVIYQPNKCGMYVVGKRNILSPFFITAHLREF